MNAEKVVANVLIKRRLEPVWQKWTEPGAAGRWGLPATRGQCSVVTYDPKVGGSLAFRLEMPDRHERYSGEFTKVIACQLIEYRLDDGRTGAVEFQHIDDNTIVRKSFDPDPLIAKEIQYELCQAGLNAFKIYVEGQ